MIFDVKACLSQNAAAFSGGRGVSLKNKGGA